MSTDEPYLPFALPEIGEEEIAEVLDCLQSGWITTGPKTRQFEKDFADLFDCRQLHAIAVNSATAGLHLALEAIGIGPGDEVITTTHTFTATAEVVRYLGGEPVFVDIDANSYCIDAGLVEDQISEKTKAILPVHYAGRAADMDALNAIAERHGLKVIEDAAHALPTRYHGRLVGELPTAAAVYSFYATKTIATGEGGMLVTSDPAIAARAKIMRLHGIDRDAFDRYHSNKPSWYYEVVAPGYKYNMTDIAAAMGIHQLRKMTRFHERRLQLAQRYDEAFADLPLTLPPRPDAAADHAWHLYVIRIDADADSGRDTVIDALHAARIGSSVHYVPLHQQPYWRDRYSLNAGRFPVSQQLYENGLSLPIYTRMSDADQDRVIRTVRSCFGTD